MKKLLIIAAVCASSAVWAGPMGQGPQRDFSQQRAERMQKFLKLNDDQTKKLTSIYKQEFDSMQKLHSQTDDQVKSVLTKEQYQKLQQAQTKRREHFRDMMKERREKWGKRHHNGAGAMNGQTQPPMAPPPAPGDNSGE